MRHVSRIRLIRSLLLIQRGTLCLRTSNLPDIVPFCTWPLHFLSLGLSSFGVNVEFFGRTVIISTRPLTFVLNRERAM